MKDNLQHVAGIIVGFVNRFTGIRYTKASRGTRWFSTVAANLVANRQTVSFWPYR